MVQANIWEYKVAVERGSEVFIKTVLVLTVINWSSNYSVLTDNNAVALAILKLPQTLSTPYFWDFLQEIFISLGKKKKSSDPLYGVDVPLVLIRGFRQWTEKLNVVQQYGCAKTGEH